MKMKSWTLVAIVFAPEAPAVVQLVDNKLRGFNGIDADRPHGSALVDVVAGGDIACRKRVQHRGHANHRRGHARKHANLVLGLIHVLDGLGERTAVANRPRQQKRNVLLRTRMHDAIM
jgi:hypothetical protein